MILDLIIIIKSMGIISDICRVRTSSKQYKTSPLLSLGGKKTQPIGFERDRFGMRVDVW